MSISIWNSSSGCSSKMLSKCPHLRSVIMVELADQLVFVVTGYVDFLSNIIEANREDIDDEEN